MQSKDVWVREKRDFIDFSLDLLFRLGLVRNHVVEI